MKSAGFSLISLMVGVLVAVLATLGMLSLYKAVVQSVYNPNSGVQNIATRQRHTETGLMTIQVAMQNAGFGLVSPAVNHYFILASGTQVGIQSGSAVLQTPGTQVSIGSTAVSGNAVFWEENPSLSANSSQWVCHGVVSDLGSYALYFLTSTQPCEPLSSAWSSQVWQVVRIVAPGVYTSPLSFSAQILATPCTPFGSEIPTSTLAAINSGAAAINQSSSHTAGLQISLNWAGGSGHTPWVSCLMNFR